MTLSNNSKASLTPIAVLSDDSTSCSMEILSPLTLSLDEPPVPAGPVPERHFMRQRQNPGWVVPYFLSSEERAAAARPPSRIKTLEERLNEFSPEEKDKIKSMTEMVRQRGWLDAIDATVEPTATGDAVNGHAVTETGSPQRTFIMGGKFDCDQWRVIRYLVARSFNITKAMTMLEASIKWESVHRPRHIVCMKCEVAPEDHMMQFCGWDLMHRPIVYASFALAGVRDNPADALIHCTESFEHLKRQMPAGVEQWTCVTDFVGYSYRRDGSVKVGKVIIDALQNHYPERLGLYIFIDPPRTFSMAWKLLQSFIDEKTRKKVLMVYTDEKERKNNVHIEQVMKDTFPPYVTEYFVYLSKYIRHQREKKSK